MEGKNVMKIKFGTVILILIIVLLLIVIGTLCLYIYNNRNSNTNNAIADNAENNVTNDTANNNTSDDIYAKLLTGDFSAFAGVYVNSKGDTLTLLSSGLIEDSLQPDESLTVSSLPTKQSDGTYTWAIYYTDMSAGYEGVLYPIGVSVQYDDLASSNAKKQDDASKVRLATLQARPSDESQIYYKK